MIAAALALLMFAQPVTPALSAQAGAAQATAPAELAIDGFRFTADAPVTPALRRSLEAQVRIVTDARLQPGILASFRARPIRLAPHLGQPGVTGPNGVTLEMSLQPEENPVLLHELVHLHHLTRRRGDPTILAAYADARASGRWPAGSYMLSNPREFFAMTASTLLHGRAARPPFTAAALRAAMPDFTRWIEREFRGE